MTTVPTPLEFATSVADLPVPKSAEAARNLLECAITAARSVLRAQQVRDAARGAAPTTTDLDASCEAPDACPKCGGVEGMHTLRSCATAPVSPGVGPLAESEDRELVEAVALAVCDAVRGRGGFDALSDWAHERYRGDARVSLDARAAHLATRALRPAREVAHELIRARGWMLCVVAADDDSGSHYVTCDVATAAIERDRAGGRR